MIDANPPSLLPQLGHPGRGQTDQVLAFIDGSMAGGTEHRSTGMAAAQPSAEMARRLLIDAPADGCALHFEAGTGELLPFIEEHFDEVVAVDSSPMRAQWSRGRVKLCEDGRLPFPDGIFDFVCGSLDHARRRRLRAYVTEAHRVLVPGGVLRLRVGSGCSTYGIRLTLTTSPFEDFNAGAYSVERRWVTARRR